MLPKAHWLLNPGCLALGEWSHHCDYLGHEDLFLYSSSVYSCHLFVISSASVRSIPFLSFTEPIFAWNVPLVSLIFLKRSLVFPSLLFSSISLHWSLRKAFLSLCAILWNSAFKWVYLSFSSLPFTSLEPQLFVRPPQATILPFCTPFSGVLVNISRSIHVAAHVITSSPRAEFCMRVLLEYLLFSR